MSRRADMIILAAIATALGVAAVAHTSGATVVGPGGNDLGVMCWLRGRLGIECPFCGMTRSVVSLFDGNLAAAWKWHPAGPVMATWMIGVAGWIAIAAFRQRPPVYGRTSFVQLTEAAALFSLTGGVIRTVFSAVSI